MMPSITLGAGNVFSIVDVGSSLLAPLFCLLVLRGDILELM